MSPTRRPWILPCAVWILAASGLYAATMEWRLVLDDASRTAKKSGSGDMEIQVMEIDGALAETGHGFAPYYNRGDHRARIRDVVMNDERLAGRIDVTLEADGWVKGGKAAYTVDLVRTGDRAAGSYTGTFQGQSVTGTVTAVRHVPHVRAVPGWSPPAPGEHPRLMFRTSDLPILRRRAETEPGRTIRALVRDARYQARAGARWPSWVAAGLGVEYRLTGDPAHAAAARKILDTRTFPRPVTAKAQDIHHAPPLLGVAWTYDLCYDAWDEAYRRQVAAWMRDRIRELARGRVGDKFMRGYNPNPWSNHNAIRMGCLGTAALALLGEVDADGQPVIDAEAVADRAERHVVRWLRMGLGASGWCPEGTWYKRFSLSNGVLQFMNASLHARGRDLRYANPLMLVGQAMEAGGHDADIAAAGDEFDPFAGGVWAMGFNTFLPAHVPGMKGVFLDTREVERGNYDCVFGWHAGYLLANYPFDTAAVPPSESLPWAAPDMRLGHHVFWSHRPDAEDFTVVFNALHHPYTGMHYERQGMPAFLNVRGLGRWWISSPWMPDPHIRNARNTWCGGRTLSCETTPDRTAVLTFDFDRLYMQEAKWEYDRDPAMLKKKGWRLVRLPNWPNPFLDKGVRADGALALDFSGTCGAPALLVFLNRIRAPDVKPETPRRLPPGVPLPRPPPGAAKGGGKPTWEMEFAKPLTIAGRTFTVGDPEGAHLRGTVVVPGDAVLRKERAMGERQWDAWSDRREHAALARLVVDGGNEFLVVMTVQNGEAPAVATAAEGMAASVTIGERTVRMKNQRIVLE